MPMLGVLEDGVRDRDVSRAMISFQRREVLGLGLCKRGHLGTVRALVLTAAGSNLIEAAAVLGVLADVLCTTFGLGSLARWLIVGVTFGGRVVVIDETFALEEILFAAFLTVVF